MKSDYSKKGILSILYKQLLFFSLLDSEKKTIENNIEKALARVKHNFSFSKNKYYKKNGIVFFSPFHSGQWTIFLYYLSNTIYKLREDSEICDKIYYLNRMMNSCDLYYEVSLPDVFFLDHPVGSVMGRAEYGNFFSFSQGCTVGNNKGIFPKFGNNVIMMSNSKVLGRCAIGNNVIISANTYIKDTDIPDNSIIFGSSPNLIIKNKKI